MFNYYKITSNFETRVGEAFLSYRAGDVIEASDPLVQSHAQYLEGIEVNVAELRDLIAKAIDTRRELSNLAQRSGEAATPGVQQRVTNLARSLDKSRDAITDELAATESKIERIKALAIRNQGTGGVETAFGGSKRSEDQANSEIRRQLDGHVSRGLMVGENAERVESLCRSGSEEDQSLTRRWAKVTGDPAYVSAFAKLMHDQTRGHLLWTAEESEAYRAANVVRAALGISTGSGSELVPIMLDPAIMLTNGGSANPLRAMARVVQITGSSWNGVTSAGVTAAWKAEHAEAVDTTPTADPAPIPVFMGTADALASYELFMDAPTLMRDLQDILMDAAEQLNATAYVVGNGTTQPTGFVTALAGTSSEINSVASEALASGDVYALQNALGPRFQANAQWAANLAVINTLAQFETTGGSLKFPEISEGRLLRRPLNEVSNMDGLINPAATASNFVMAYGDWKAGFVIVDRIGATVELLPGYGPNGRPTAQRHMFLTWRTGSDVVNPSALRLLDVPTTA